MPSKSVVLSQRHVKMLEELGTSLAEIARDAIEERYAMRSDVKYARVCVEEDLKDCMVKWRSSLGLYTSLTITDTQDGGMYIVLSAVRSLDSE